MSDCTRRFELGLPLLSGLDMGALMSAHDRLKKGEPQGLTDFISALGTIGETHVMRRLATIQLASDEDLSKIEVDKKFRAKLEEAQAQAPFGESARAAFGFFGGLMASLGVSLPSSAEDPTEEDQTTESMSPEGSPLGSS